MRLNVYTNPRRFYPKSSFAGRTRHYFATLVTLDLSSVICHEQSSEDHQGYVHVLLKRKTVRSLSTSVHFLGVGSALPSLFLVLRLTSSRLSRSKPITSVPNFSFISNILKPTCGKLLTLDHKRDKDTTSNSTILHMNDILSRAKYN